MTRRIEVAGTRVSLAEAGTGPGTCVLVHGTGTSSRSWLRTIAPLAMRFRVVAPDLPGFGASPRHRGPVSIERYADLLNALVDHLGPGPMHLVGHSMGGLVSLTALLRRPERYERLVLIGSTAITLLGWPDARPPAWFVTPTWPPRCAASLPPGFCLLHLARRGR